MTDSTNNGNGSRLSVWQLVGYGQFIVPLAIIGLPIGIYIPAFYALWGLISRQSVSSS